MRSLSHLTILGAPPPELAAALSADASWAVESPAAAQAGRPRRNRPGPRGPRSTRTLTKEDDG